ncbi:MAG: HAD family hydrolase [Magnetococcales bacterium]|nr:HAD family hydrolase [Magnetococcales bacterium]
MKSELRDRLIQQLEEEMLYPAMQSAREIVAQESGIGRWRFLKKCVANLPEGAKGLKPVRVALLASFSIEFIQDSLLALGLVHGLQIKLYPSGFAQYHQEIVDPNSQLYAFKPDLVVLALEGERLAPALYEDFLTNATNPAQTQAQDRLVKEVMGLVSTFRSRWDGTLLIHNMDDPQQAALGLLDGHLDGAGQRSGVAAVNRRLLEEIKQLSGVFLLDYAALVGRFGQENWYDRRMALYAQAPISQGLIHHLAGEYLKVVRGVKGLAKKCLVLDLDNTLWGGVLGEEGVEGVALGANYPGSAYRAFQRAVLTLYNRGVILAIASKNNVDDVDELFAQNRFMVLKKEQFTLREIHWQPKPLSLEKIAKTLNIGLEHLVFIDDNPVECEAVCVSLPEVTVLPFPANRPEEAVDLLFAEGLFDSLSFSEEDRNRSQLYQQRAEAEQLRGSSGSLEDFYRSLEMVVTIAAVQPQTLARTAQLTQKTNQFNLTTYRYGESEVAERMADPSWILLTLQVTDRFGDNGIVGVVMAQQVDKALHLDTFLLSCRVIGRTVETALLAELCRLAVARGVTCLIGQVIPTPKNLPARELYQQHGFTLVDEEKQLWKLTLSDHQVKPLPWLTVVTEGVG